MKVALLSAYSLDATMPLTKHLADEGVDVHLYGLMPQYDQNVFVIDFLDNKQPNGFVNNKVLVEKMGPRLCQYLSGIDTKFFIYPAGSGKKALLQDIYHAWKLSQHLIKGKFDVVHLIHTANRFSLLLIHFLKKEHLIQTLHEVTAHTGKTNSYDVRLLQTLIRKNIPIIFHSDVSQDRFLKFRSTATTAAMDKDLVTMIRFGLHETYLHFTPLHQKDTPQTSENAVPIVLHIGRIVPYKGIEILVDAIKIVQKTQPVHLIVAGGGKPYFSFDGVDSYELLNYSIGNEEIIELIKKCTLVVCPYRSASQSGIPMTVSPFHKPIIASNIGGLKEVIDDKITGLLVQELEPAAFAEAITYLISNKALREEMAVNIDKKFQQGEFSWPYIAKKTVGFYKKHYPGN